MLLILETYEVCRSKPQAAEHANENTNPAVMPNDDKKETAVNTDVFAPKSNCFAVTLKPPEQFVSSHQPEGCANTAGWIDEYGDGCAYYDRSWCVDGAPLKSSDKYTQYAVGGVSALDACCTCGGGGLWSNTIGMFLLSSEKK